jgi:hypothetical protein
LKPKRPEVSPCPPIKSGIRETVHNPGRRIGVCAGFLLSLAIVAWLATPSFGEQGKDLLQGATPNEFFENLSKTARRGLYPRCFSGEQSYWTVIGVDGGGASTALISEDGAVELGKGGFSIEPFLMTNGRFVTWSDVDTAQSLHEGYLPMPGVTWKTQALTFHVEAFAAGSRTNSRLLMRYTVENRNGDTREVSLVLAVRPFQVNPPTQSLNMLGGVSPIHSLVWNGNVLEVNGNPRVFPLQRPDAFVASGSKAGSVVARLAAGDHPTASHVTDDLGYASGAMLFHLVLPPHGRRTMDLLAPLAGSFHVPDDARKDPDGWTLRERDAAAAQWHMKVNRVSLHVPRSAQAVADTLRTSLAYILISREGPALQPGTRSYARTWIRDGAMMSEALVRMGEANVVRDFICWYAPHQFTSGKTPCCVDARGPDPVPENDSHGELIFTVAELYRFTHERSALEALWPYVVGAVNYMDRLRADERTPANLTVERRAYYGMMPASISHEGYAAKPVHSYWDDFWALKGYDDALYLARALGKSEEAKRFGGARDQFRGDLLASIRAAVNAHGIRYLPGSAELGDFDATSTTIALSPGGDREWLPQDLLENTFELYWKAFLARRDAKAEWEDYTPYEIRSISAFIHLGRRHCVKPLLDFFMADRRPAAWNGWAEVVRRDARKPGFVGDMPHAWIASDYIRSVLDMFAYRRTVDGSMILAAGVPVSWLDGLGVGISGLETPWGRLSYTLRRQGDRLHLRLHADALPPGGFVLKWPYAGAPGKAMVNGHEAAWQNGELGIEDTDAEVSIGLSLSSSDLPSRTSFLRYPPAPVRLLR